MSQVLSNSSIPYLYDVCRVARDAILIDINNDSQCMHDPLQPYIHHNLLRHVVESSLRNQRRLTGFNPHLVSAHLLQYIVSVTYRYWFDYAAPIPLEKLAVAVASHGPFLPDLPAMRIDKKLTYSQAIRKLKASGIAKREDRQACFTSNGWKKYLDIYELVDLDGNFPDVWTFHRTYGLLVDKPSDLTYGRRERLELMCPLAFSINRRHHMGGLSEREIRLGLNFGYIDIREVQLAEVILKPSWGKATVRRLFSVLNHMPDLATKTAVNMATAAKLVYAGGRVELDAKT